MCIIYYLLLLWHGSFFECMYILTYCRRICTLHGCSRKCACAVGGPLAPPTHCCITPTCAAAKPFDVPVDCFSRLYPLSFVSPRLGIAEKMSSFVDGSGEDVRAAYEDVRSDETETNWWVSVRWLVCGRASFIWDLGRANIVLSYAVLPTPFENGGGRIFSGFLSPKGFPFRVFLRSCCIFCPLCVCECVRILTCSILSTIYYLCFHSHIIYCSCHFDANTQGLLSLWRWRARQEDRVRRIGRRIRGLACSFRRYECMWWHDVCKHEESLYVFFIYNLKALKEGSYATHKYPK